MMLKNINEFVDVENQTGALVTWGILGTGPRVPPPPPPDDGPGGTPELFIHALTQAASQGDLNGDYIHSLAGLTNP
jgi:hypothetical protein